MSVPTHKRTGFEHLIPIVGRAPSELSEAELHERVTRERQRVSGALAEWHEEAEAMRERKKKKGKKKKGKGK